MKSKIFLLICFHSFSFALYSQGCYVAILKDGIDSLRVETIELDSTTIYPSEKFIIYRGRWSDKTVQVWTKKGDRIFSFKSNYVEILPNEVAFKMVTNLQTLFRVSCSERSIKLFEKYDMDICETVKLAANKDVDALKKIFTLTELVKDNKKGRLILSLITWDLFHLYDDEEICSFLKGLNRNFRDKIAEYITSPHGPISGWKIDYSHVKQKIILPITNTETYFKTNFPKTWRIIKKNRYKYDKITIIL
jgi:hypothetical protein